MGGFSWFLIICCLLCCGGCCFGYNRYYGPANANQGHEDYHNCPHDMKEMNEIVDSQGNRVMQGNPNYLNGANLGPACNDQNCGPVPAPQNCCDNSPPHNYYPTNTNFGGDRGTPMAYGYPAQQGYGGQPPSQPGYPNYGYPAAGLYNPATPGLQQQQGQGGSGFGYSSGPTFGQSSGDQKSPVGQLPPGFLEAAPKQVASTPFDSQIKNTTSPMNKGTDYPAHTVQSTLPTDSKWPSLLSAVKDSKNPTASTKPGASTNVQESTIINDKIPEDWKLQSKTGTTPKDKGGDKKP